MEVDKKLFGKRLKALRLEKGMTLEEFGNKVVNSNKSVVSKWENGVSLPNPERLRIIAEYFDTTVEELLEPQPIFKNRIKQLRNEQNISLEQLSEALNVSLDSLNKYEKGKSYPQLGLIKEIADYFKVSENYLTFYSDIKDYPIKNTEDIINILDLLKSNKIYYDDLSTNTLLSISYLYYSNKSLFLNNEDYYKYIDTVRLLANYVYTEHKISERYKSIRNKENMTLNKINEKLLDSMDYFGANAIQVLEFMEQSERIEYKEIEKILKYMKSLPDKSNENDEIF